MPDFDFLTKSSPTEDHSLLPNSKTAYHPQTDGETERVNQEIETYLRIFCGNSPSKWADHIPMAEFIHNIQPRSSTGKSPFHLIMGYKPQALPDITN